MQSALNLDKAVEIVNLVNQTLLYLSSGQTCSAFSVWSICMSTCIHLIAAMNGICQAQPQRLSSMSCNTPQTFKGIKQVGIIATFPWTKLGKLRMAEFLVHRGRVTALFNCKVEAKHILADSTYSHTELHSNQLPKTRDFCGPARTTVIGGTRQPVSEYIQHSHLFPSCVYNYIIHIMVTCFKLLDNSFTILPSLWIHHELQWFTWKASVLRQGTHHLTIHRSKTRSIFYYSAKFVLHGFSHSKPELPKNLRETKYDLNRTPPP